MQLNHRPSAIFGVIAGGLLAACGARTGAPSLPPTAQANAAATVPCSATPTALTAPSGPNVLDAALIAPNDGWVLTPTGLSATVDGGHSWKAITPPGATGQTILSVNFPAPGQGWVLWSPDGHELDLSATSDSGTTWQKQDLSPGAAQQQVRAVFDSLIGSNGWIVVDRGDTTFTHDTQLLVTSDGGRSFQARSIPVPAPVRFLSPQIGFTLGGSAADGIYVTQDGGDTWRLSSLPHPTDAASAAMDAAYPDRGTRSSNVAAVDLRNPGAAGVDGLAVYLTNDGGSTWQLHGELKLGPSWLGSIEVSVPDGADVVAVVSTHGSGAVTTYTSSDAGGQFTQACSSSFSQASGTSFIDSQTGWATAVFSGCASGKTECTYTQRLFSTADGGRSWSLIPVP